MNITALTQELDLLARQVAEKPLLKANATILFSVSSGVSGTSPISGLPIQTTTEAVLNCWLVKVTNPAPEYQEYLDRNWEYFKGALVDPKTYQFPLKATGEIAISIDNRNGVVQQAYCVPMPQAGINSVDEILGQEVAFWVEFREGR